MEKCWIVWSCTITDYFHTFNLFSVSMFITIQNIKCKTFMLIIDVSFDTVFLVYTFIANIAGKQCLTINYFYLKEVLYISYGTFLSFICLAPTSLWTLLCFVFICFHIVISPIQAISHLVKTFSSVTVSIVSSTSFNRISKDFFLYNKFQT